MCTIKTDINGALLLIAIPTSDIAKETRLTKESSDISRTLATESGDQIDFKVQQLQDLDEDTWLEVLTAPRPVLKICFGPPTAESKNLKNHVNFGVGDLFFRSPALWSSQNVFGPPTAGRVVVDIKDRDLQYTLSSASSNFHQQGS